ncbi:site-specific integrase [Lactiplantibacillus mudanjiangensis]|uniref:Integrase [Lactobacillus plantarum subsp. plantarum ST-III] n=1 Tax=Lactiplantibacillus mudanjiangensis TaxID=1296538 RepID=A0A660DX36_9LACO|nr:site-specific integrase [Lactiplantibacillus mudanjiangensis]VDG25738.1 integrase [Lactobacillus plantarum subsp. plantarum ST-III] [Lactiplantibacillus mudanjiangensis]VDG27913.1 integrase [Lactobacillus plantarum subsp. plantarum ST-III] [Lactiplantibacillus mudanjiangensis]
MRKWEALKRHPGIYQYSTQKGKRYGARRGYTDLYGKRQEWTRSGFLSWRDADVALNQIELKISDGSLAQVHGASITLDTYFQQIYNRKIKLKIWRKSTAKGMKNYYTEWFKEPFGHQNIDDISRINYQHYLDEISTKNLAKSTISRIDSVMQLIMNDAETNDIIAKNRLRHMDINGREPRKQSLEPAEYEKYVRYAKEHLSKYYFCMIYLLTLGERRSELMGMRTRSSFKFDYDDVNKRDICGITFNLGRTPDAPEGGPLKTPSAYRTIWVYGDIVDMIKYAISYSDSILTNLGQPVPDDHFLWLNPTTGKPFHPAQPSTLMLRISKKCGIKVHPHQLRHYFATNAKTDNLPDMDVMHWLGHANIQQTNDYTRPTQRGAMGVFEGISKNI